MPIRLDHSRADVPSAIHTTAAAEPHRLAGRFHPSTLGGQFVMSRDAAHIPETWRAHAQGGWVLGTHPTLPVITLHTSDGAVIGWMVGYPIDPSGRMVAAHMTVPCTRPVWCDAFEDAIYRLGGRWVALLVSPRAARVYLDPAGSMAAVYSRAHEMIASTTSLVPYSRGCDDDTALLHTAGIPHACGLLPFGLTPRRGVARLLPNHFLDLETFEARRHWPADPLVMDVDPARAVERVAAIVKRHVGAIVGIRSTYAGLTAGYDSRLVAACTRAHLDRIQFITFELPDTTARIDCEVAGHLAQRLGLPHRIVPFQTPSPRELDEWLWRCGSEIGERRGQSATATYRRLDPSRAEITGQAGELCRATYWFDAGRPKAVRIADVLRVLRMPQTPEMTDRAERWVRSVPARDAVQLYDFLYIEQWLGCWGGVLPYAEPDATAFRVYPLVHREAFAHMLRLPNEYKLSGRFPRDLIAAEWPELLVAPFNRPVGARHYVRVVRRQVWKTRQSAARLARAAGLVT